MQCIQRLMLTLAALCLVSTTQTANLAASDDSPVGTSSELNSTAAIHHVAVEPKPPKLPVSQIKPIDKSGGGREGGETIATALIVLDYDMPYTDFGYTCDNIDDYEEVCPFAGSTSPDVVYRFLNISGPDKQVDISLCNPFTDYDTKLFVYDEDTNLVACNDDACANYRSEVFNILVKQDSSIYIVVDGYGYNNLCGNYGITIVESPCSVECPPGASNELETCAIGNRENDGCNLPTPAFETINCGDTICGAAWADTSGRDTDWYELVLIEPSTVQFHVQAEFPALTGFIEMTVPGSGDCADATGFVAPYALSGPCEAVTTQADLPAGTHWLFVAPQFDSLTDCSNYTASVECVPFSGISMDSVGGGTAVLGGWTLTPDVPIDIHLHLTNNEGLNIYGLTNGFEVYSPDGATWQPISGAWNPAYDWAGNYFDAYVGIIEASVTGSGADSVGFGGGVAVQPGIPDGFSDIIWTISTQVNSVDFGKHLCIDSAFVPSSYYWLWGMQDGIGVTPDWDGPHCFLIEAAPNQSPNEPVATNPSNGAVDVLVNLATSGGTLQFHGGDPDGDPVFYDIYFGTSTNPPQLVAGTNSTFWYLDTLLPLDYSTMYYWRVDAYDAQDTTASTLFSFTTEAGGPAAPGITLDNVDGDIARAPGWALTPDVPITFNLRLTNNEGLNIVGLTNGFEVYSPDGATWQPISGAWNPAYDWAGSYFDLFISTVEVSVTGSGADSIGFGGVSMYQPGIPDGFSDITWSISTQVSSTDIGKHLCIDSAFVPASYYWLWAMQGGGEATPGWDGPHCFSIGDCNGGPDPDGDGRPNPCDNCPDVYNPLQEDANGNGVGDVCDGCCVGIRGDANSDGSLDVADLTFIVDYLFNNGSASDCDEEADVNGSGGIDVADVTYLVDYLFGGGPPPPGCA